jgi:hypothetical protein
MFEGTALAQLDEAIDRLAAEDVAVRFALRSACC